MSTCFLYGTHQVYQSDLPHQATKHVTYEILYETNKGQTALIRKSKLTAMISNLEKKTCNTYFLLASAWSLLILAKSFEHRASALLAKARINSSLCNSNIPSRISCKVEMNRLISLTHLCRMIFDLKIKQYNRLSWNPIHHIPLLTWQSDKIVTWGFKFISAQFLKKGKK